MEEMETTWAFSVVGPLIPPIRLHFHKARRAEASTKCVAPLLHHRPLVESEGRFKLPSSNLNL